MRLSIRFRQIGDFVGKVQVLREQTRPNGVIIDCSNSYPPIKKGSENMRKIVMAGMMAAVALAAPAEAKPGVKIGVLTCGVEGGVGFIIGSSKNVECLFKSVRGRTEQYEGTIGKLGVDIGVTKKTVLAWAVFAPGSTKRGGLKGSYGGASAEATAGLGLGANVLVGGFRNTINLQPISVQAQTGLNVAAGLAGLNLRYAE
jgi:Protein of unknown function (DUF992)